MHFWIKKLICTARAFVALLGCWEWYFWSVRILLLFSSDTSLNRFQPRKQSQHFYLGQSPFYGEHQYLLNQMDQTQSISKIIVPFCKAQKTKYWECYQFFQWRKDQGSEFPSTSKWLRSACVIAPAFQPWLNLLFCIWSLVIEYFSATIYIL